jgi:membrane protein
MLQRLLVLTKSTFRVFGAQRSASRGAAIAFYTITSIAPILLVVVAIAGIVFGREAASGALFEQFRGLMGSQGADLLQKAIASASSKSGGIMASIISLVTLILAASGVFLELEDALNAIWEAQPQSGLFKAARARVISLGLVIALGFLLIVSLVVDAALKALASSLPVGAGVLMVVSFVVSLTLLTSIFAAILKYLPAKSIAWRDVTLGAAVTALLFEIGKFLIGVYLGSSSTFSSLGAAGSLLALLLWAYYSAQIFLFGAAFTKVSSELSRPVGGTASHFALNDNAPSRGHHRAR